MHSKRISRTSAPSANALNAARGALVAMTAAVAVVSLFALAFSICDASFEARGKAMQETTLGSSYRTSGITP